VKFCTICLSKVKLRHQLITKLFLFWGRGLKSSLISNISMGGDSQRKLLPLQFLLFKEWNCLLW